MIAIIIGVSTVRTRTFALFFFFFVWLIFAGKKIHVPAQLLGNREVTHDVYSKRPTANMKLLSSLFSCVCSRVKLFVFAMSSRRRYYIFVGFIYGLEEKN